ncbi:hypothetical protein Peur_021401 [Populus x canadensis]
MEEAKLSVLSGGPYLIFGRPLILRPMTKFFDFSSEEMSRVPVWVKFPNLPLCSWSPICLSKISSVLGKPIQCDQPTSTLSRISYVRVLVEIDLLEDLRHSVEISLPEGPALRQPVVYEALPKNCTFCHVLGHTQLLCLKAAASQDMPRNQPLPPATQADKGNVFSRLGPQPPLQPSPALPQVQTQQDDAILVDFTGDVGSEVDLEPTNVWVIVESRCKSRKQDKGKAVEAFEPGVETNLIPSSSPVCTGPVQPSSGTNPLVATPCVADVRASSPPCTESLAQPPCGGNEHRPSPPPKILSSLLLMMLICMDHLSLLL